MHTQVCSYELCRKVDNRKKIEPKRGLCKQDELEIVYHSAEFAKWVFWEIYFVLIHQLTYQ